MVAVGGGGAIAKALAEKPANGGLERETRLGEAYII